MLTGVAVRLGGEALEGGEQTVALWPWGWGGQGCWARDGGVARPRPMEHDAQPYECDQRELVEEKMRYHGKPPHTRAEMRVFYPVCQVAELAAGYRYTTVRRLRLILPLSPRRACTRSSWLLTIKPLVRW